YSSSNPHKINNIYAFPNRYFINIDFNPESKNTIYCALKSSVETTETNNGFQPGDKKRTYKTIFIGEKSSVGTTDINNGFQPGAKQSENHYLFFQERVL
ncbi:MAG: hypothetical protein WBK79_07655, partial [Candidatus Cloacimonas acidaminovorans]